MNRRSFLTTLLAVPLAGIKLPPTPGTWAAIERSEIPFFKPVLYGGSAGGGKSDFLYVMTLQQKLFYENPRLFGRIDGIEQ